MRSPRNITRFRHIADINMPSLDGVALVRAIAGMKPDITFLATRGGEASQASELESLGIKNFLMKPFNIDNLLKQLRGALEGRPSEPLKLCG